MKKILIALIIIILAVGSWFYFKKTRTIETPASVTAEETATSTIQIASSTPPLQQASAGQAEKDAAWAVLQNYIAAAKAKNVTSLASLSYQLSPSCKDYNKSDDAKKDCDAKMASVANMGSQLVKSHYTEIWSDNKQIILSTSYSRADSGTDIAGYLHGVIFFTKDNGAIKLLSFNPVRGIFLPKTATSTEAEISKKLISSIRDNDKDGMEDDVENCYRVDTTCTKTDPTKRDTDGDGWWDGVEALFYK